MLNLNCWLCLIPAPQLDSKGVRIETSERTLGFEHLSELISSSEGSEDVTKVINEIFEYFSTLLGGPFLQVQLDRILLNAARECPHSEMYMSTAQSYESFDPPQQ